MGVLLSCIIEVEVAEDNIVFKSNIRSNNSIKQPDLIAAPLKSKGPKYNSLAMVAYCLITSVGFQ